MSIKELRSLNFGGDDTYVPAQSDWNQNDASQPDYIKNKPFGDEVVEIMPETQIVGEPSDDFLVAYLTNASFTGTEETLLVNFDGVEYTCVNVAGFMGLTIFGNMGLVGEVDTGEPFMIDPFGELIGEPLIAVADAEPHTVKITAIGAKKLDDKYFNHQTVFYISTDTRDHYLYTDSTLGTKATFEDIRAVSGKTPIQLLHNQLGMTMISHTPTTVSIISGCGEVTIKNWNNTGDTFLIYYTAEYTG